MYIVKYSMYSRVVILECIIDNNRMYTSNSIMYIGSTRIGMYIVSKERVVG